MPNFHFVFFGESDFLGELPSFFGDSLLTAFTTFTAVLREILGAATVWSLGTFFYCSTLFTAYSS
jgi:hypothetical protein